MDAFLQPPQHVGPHQLHHAPAKRAFQGISSLAVSANHRLWVTWYAGITPEEDENNYVVLATSGDKGKSWHEVLTVDPDGPGPVRAFDPQVWIGPDGKLRLFWAQSIGHNGTVSGTWMMTRDDPDSESGTWSAPRRLMDGIMMCKPLVLTSGEWVLPISTWKKTDNSAKMAVSTDLGKSWSIRGACNVPQEDREFDEHMFIERKDGSLWLLLRTLYGIAESTSVDRGRTWSTLKPTAIPHTSSRFFISRLASGKLLLVKHGSMSECTGRSHLTAFLSDDDGHSWQGGLLLDARKGISYPDGQQHADGRIYITYDFDRRNKMEICFAEFGEDDVTSGRSDGPGVRLQQQVIRINP